MNNFVIKFKVLILKIIVFVILVHVILDIRFILVTLNNDELLIIISNLKSIITNIKKSF